MLFRLPETSSQQQEDERDSRGSRRKVSILSLVKPFVSLHDLTIWRESIKVTGYELENVHKSSLIEEKHIILGFKGFRKET